MDNLPDFDATDAVISTISAELEKAAPSQKQRIFEAVVSAALGSVPWVGGVLAAAATFKFDESAVKSDSLRDQWLREHQKKLLRLQGALQDIFGRLDSLWSEVAERIESEEYLMLVRKTFREWDAADTEEKRRILEQFITNAAATRVCTDDTLRLFLTWIDDYHEAHFAVIRHIYRNPRSTRYDIWIGVYGDTIPTDDSAEADLYKMLIRDLNLGGVIRQARESDSQGRFRKQPRAPRRTTSSTLESPFEDTKEYVLTGMGKQFVHYTMNEVVTRLESEGLA